MQKTRSFIVNFLNSFRHRLPPIQRILPVTMLVIACCSCSDVQANRFAADLNSPEPIASQIAETPDTSSDSAYYSSPSSQSCAALEDIVMHPVEAPSVIVASCKRVYQVQPYMPAPSSSYNAAECLTAEFQIAVSKSPALHSLLNDTKTVILTLTDVSEQNAFQAGQRYLLYFEKIYVDFPQKSYGVILHTPDLPDIIGEPVQVRYAPLLEDVETTLEQAENHDFSDLITQCKSFEENGSTL